MTDYNRGDVVLVRYQASADEDPWLRPAVVTSSETYHQGRNQVILAAVTSNPQTLRPGDPVVQAWQEAELVGPSVVTGILLTVAPESLERHLGTLDSQDMQAVESSLRLSLGL
ncbi:type II toxin-antitoxin system PemK/MazF family toxin [Chloroflexota bacterium]